MTNCLGLLAAVMVVFTPLEDSHEKSVNVK